MKRKFSWMNFLKFLAVSFALFVFIWLLWGIVDINLHNEKRFEAPSNFNPYILFVQLLESEVN